MRLAMLIAASTFALALGACSQHTQDHADRAANQAAAAATSAGQDVKSAADTSASAVDHAVELHDGGRRLREPQGRRRREGREEHPVGAGAAGRYALDQVSGASAALRRAGHARARGTFSMRRATLDKPPIFHLTAADGGRLTLASDTGALAHVFVPEEDIVRLLVLPDGRLRHGRTWTIAPGEDDVADEGRDRFDLGGFACPPFEVDEATPGRLELRTGKCACASASGACAATGR